MTDELSNDSTYENETRDRTSGLERARTELKRAYVQMGFGQFEEASESCSRAATMLGEHYLPETLRAAVLSASGRHREAIAALKVIRKKYPEQALPHLYFAEACFLSGRRRQAQRALNCAQDCETSTEEASFLERLRTLWNQIEPSEVPPPLEPMM
ncbi:MAG: tetratricopeptide repeat protein [Myxococcota bacterium]